VTTHQYALLFLDYISMENIRMEYYYQVSFLPVLRFILKLELGHNFFLMDLNGIRGLMFHNKIVLKWEK